MWWLIKAAVSLAIIVLPIAGAWRIYEKAGQAGWISLIPILNVFGALKIIGKPFWWVVFYIPPLTPVAHFVVSILIARSFGKSALFGVGMFFLPFFFVPALGLGDARYLGPDRSF